MFSIKPCVIQCYIAYDDYGYMGWLNQSQE